jgi:hypothetical protein
MTLTFALIEDDTQPLRPTTLSDSRGAGRAVILPMLPLSWVNHIAPSGPGVMPNGLLPGGRGYSLVVPLVVILSAQYSLNHRAPSRPPAICSRPLLGLRTANSLRTPAGVIRPIHPSASVNQRAASDPTAIPCDVRPPGTRKRRLTPSVVILPIPLSMRLLCVNHSALSGPVAMSTGDKKAVGRPGTPATSGNSVIAPSVVMRPIRSEVLSPSAPPSVNQSAPSGPATIFDGNAGADDLASGYLLKAPSVV